jgi:hypothetical protein
VTSVQASAEAIRAPWRMVRRTIVVRGIPRTLRLVQFPSGWIASADTESGPTMAVDPSPHLAASRALEPAGIGMVEAMMLVGSVEATPRG